MVLTWTGWGADMMLWCHHMSCCGSRPSQTMFRAIRSCKISRRAEEELTSGHLHLNIVVGQLRALQQPPNSPHFAVLSQWSYINSAVKNKPKQTTDRQITHKKGGICKLWYWGVFIKKLICAVTQVSHVEHILAIKLIIIWILKLLPPSSCLGTKGILILFWSG